MRCLALALAAATAALVPYQTPTDDSPVELDHVFLMVTPGAPERAALEKLGFRIAPAINRHAGQGTASATIEFVNGFFEMTWPDSSVPVAEGKEYLRDRWRQRMEWRTRGRSPVSIGLRRRSATNDSLPFPTYPITAPWLPPGSAIQRLTPLTDSLGAALFVGPRALVIPPDSNIAALIRGGEGAWPLRHPNGCRRITGCRVIAPPRALNQSTRMLDRWNVVQFLPGDEWCVELILDRGRKGKRSDLRPELPLIVRY